MCAELDGSVRDDPDHGGRVPTPQAEETFIEVGAVDESISLLNKAKAEIRTAREVSTSGLIMECSRADGGREGRELIELVSSGAGNRPEMEAAEGR